MRSRRQPARMITLMTTLVMTLAGALEARPVILKDLAWEEDEIRVPVSSRDDDLAVHLNTSLGREPVLERGDRLRFSLITEEPAYLTLVEIGSSGRVQILSPAQRRLQPGRLTWVPGDGRFVVQGPRGTDVMIAIASERPLPGIDDLARRLVSPYRDPEDGPSRRLKDLVYEPAPSDDLGDRIASFERDVRRRADRQGRGRVGFARVWMRIR